MPNPLTPRGFDLEPQHMGEYLTDFAGAKLVNYRGGLLRNTPDHIAGHRQGGRSASSRVRFR